MKKEYTNILSLSYSLAKANFKLRNEGSYLGILWYLLSPLCYFIVILSIRSALFSTENIAYYPLYLTVGLTMINFFAQDIRASIGVMQSNSDFIKSAKLPLEIFVLSALFQSVFSHAFELICIAALFIYFHASILGIFAYLIVFVFYAIFTLGLSFLFATVGVYFTDLGNIWTIVSQLLLFVTPTFYMVYPGTRLYFGNLFNPLFYFLTDARDVFIYLSVPAWWMICTTIVMSFVSLAVGIFIFNRYQRHFAEMV